MHVSMGSGHFISTGKLPPAEVSGRGDLGIPLIYRITTRCLPPFSSVKPTGTTPLRQFAILQQRAPCSMKADTCGTLSHCSLSSFTWGAVRL